MTVKFAIQLRFFRWFEDDKSACGEQTEVALNIVFDLGGVVVRWEPQTLIADVFNDPEVRRLVHSEFVGHPDWVELDRGTLAPEDAVARASAHAALAQTRRGSRRELAARRDGAGPARRRLAGDEFRVPCNLA